MRRCSKCGIDKSLSEFYLRKTGNRAGEHYNHCRDCLKTRGRTYYRLNHTRQLALANKRIREKRTDLRRFVNSLKNRPCTDCGKIYPPYVMDFDHKGEKVGNIGTIVSGTLLTKSGILSEVAKCDLVCANCHRIRTYSRSHQSLPNVT